MPSSTLTGALSCFLLSIFFILAACPSEVSAWNAEYHPDHKGKKDPYIKLPDWPPYLPNWLANNRTHACYPTYDYIRDAHKLNVLWVATRFCRYEAYDYQNTSRPMQELQRQYNTNLFYQKKEDSVFDNIYTVRVRDMGEDCEIQSSVVLDDDGFAYESSKPFKNDSRHDTINVMQPFGVSSLPFLDVLV